MGDPQGARSLTEDDQKKSIVVLMPMHKLGMVLARPGMNIHKGLQHLQSSFAKYKTACACSERRL